MENSQKLYCVVYLDAGSSKDDVLSLVAGLTSGSVEGRTVHTNDLDLYLSDNEDFDETKTMDGRDQFLFYRYCLEIEPNEASAQERYIRTVGFILEGL